MFETSIEIISRVLHRYFIPINEIERHINEVRKDGYEMFRNMQQKYEVFPELRQHLPDNEIETIRIEASSPLVGKNLSEVDFRKKYGVTVLAIRRGRETITNPAGDTQLSAQDIIVLIGTKDNIAVVSSLVSPASK